MTTQEETVEMCPCGRPLHYDRIFTRQIVELLIKEHGPTVIVTVEGRSFKVSRHYIALHGLKGSDVANLGFEEVV